MLLSPRHMPTLPQICGRRPYSRSHHTRNTQTTCPRTTNDQSSRDKNRKSIKQWVDNSMKEKKHANKMFAENKCFVFQYDWFDWRNVQKTDIY